ncbi:MAG: DNA/RNA nuclease SfsA [Oscillospiraceae bacterium]|nr:DNA/RNA nuclease SfsA [Oscillospiraceae bacterium]
MTYPKVHPGVFLARPNRFLARVEIGGRETLCHVKNTGRCRELLIPGAAVWCQAHHDPRRKTGWSLITVQKGAALFNLDSQVPNRLAAQWVQDGGLGAKPENLRREQTWGDSRFDLAFTLRDTPCLLEVKGVTLEEHGTARFPDAPTARGARHLRGLAAAVAAGLEAYVLFVCQMAGVRQVEPNRRADPVFAQALQDAAEAGVHILAVDCAVTPDAIQAAGPVPVVL